MPTIIATPGSASANSYATVAQGDSYFDTILNAEDWTGQTTNDKTRGLIMATRYLDQMVEWKGIPTFADQALKYPRTGVQTQISATGGGAVESYYVGSGGLYTPTYVELPADEIPQFLIEATCEFARSLLSSDRISEQDSGNISSIEIPGLTIGYFGSGSNSKRKFIPPHVYYIIAFYVDTMVGYTARRVIRT